MNVCLITPPRLLMLFSMATVPGAPLGLAYIAGAIKNAGHRVSVIDALALGYEKYTPFHGDIQLNGLTLQEIGDHVPFDTEIIGIGCMFSGNWLISAELIDYLGGRFPNAKVIIGGEHVTAVPAYCLEQTRHLDVCVLGEGEETIVDLIKAFESGGNLNDVNGIAFRDETEQIIFSPPRSRVRNLDEISQPAWEYFPVNEYAKPEMSHGVTNYKTLPLLATRGCPYSCTFCSSPQMWGTKYSMRTVEKVVDEIEFLNSTYGIKNFDFYDLTAIVKRDWIIQFAKEIIKRKLDITWQTPAGTRSEVINDEVAMYLKASGCPNMVYAPESGSTEILHLIKKKVKLGNLLNSIKASKRQGLKVKLNIIMGFPDEKHKHIWETIWFLVKCSWHGTDDAVPSIFNPYPGSMLFNQLHEQKKVSLDDAFFLEIPTADSFTKGPVYSNHISPFMVRVYVILAILVFYGTNYLFRPFRVVKIVGNIIRKNYTTRGEMYAGELIRRSFSKKVTQTS